MSVLLKQSKYSKKVNNNNKILVLYFYSIYLGTNLNLFL
jgi:hypothetical protein